MGDGGVRGRQQLRFSKGLDGRNQGVRMVGEAPGGNGSGGTG